jgi:plasmid maintenance system antidote protein VapI
MYIIKKPGIISFLFGDNKQISKNIGISSYTLSRIINGKQATKYTTAYCITKIYDPNKEVLDYFKRV